MPTTTVNGIRLSYLDTGEGEPVVLVMGTGSAGRAWHLHQVPALVNAGYRVITYDNRGIGSSGAGSAGFTLAELVDDLAGLIECLGLGACRLVGTSMGSFVIQELALRRPELVRRAVLMATRARSDALRIAMSRAELELHDSGIQVPPRYAAAVRATWNLSPRTLNDPRQIADWLDILELADDPGPGFRAQLALDPVPDRRPALQAISVPCRVISFADDLITPAHLGQEVAEAIPGAQFQVIDGCGHYGYLEDPGAVNKSIVEFLAGEIS